MSAWTGNIGIAYVRASAAISMAVIVLIVGSLALSSWPAVAELGGRLFVLEWAPAQGTYGVVPMLYGTVAVTSIALILAVPLGLMTAVFTAEVLAERYRLVVKSVLELLAGIPSIIYGLVGVAFFGVWIGDVFDLATGRTILTAGLLLAVMILPTIITLTDDALSNVPDRYREAAHGLGLYEYEVVWDAVLPIAKFEVFGAVLLALGRALGETMAVMLVIGGIDRIPEPMGNVLVPGQTITSKLGRSIAETAFGSLPFSAMIFMGFVLTCLVLGLTLVAQQAIPTTGRLYE